MAKHMITKASNHLLFRITKKELSAMVTAADNMSAMIGCGDDDSEFKQCVKAIDRLLKRNGYKRRYN